MNVKVLLFFAGLLSLSAAQCTGSLRNDTESVSVSWRVVASNSVQFTFSIPFESAQYTTLAFSESSVAGITLQTLDQLSRVNAIYAGVNKTSDTSGEYFIEDRWIDGSSGLLELPQYDMQQDITNTSISYNNDIITVIAVIPIISTDKNQDLDFDQCLYMGWALGGPVVSFVSPIQFGGGAEKIGSFNTQICLQNCQATSTATPTSTPKPTTTPVVCSPNGAVFASGSRFILGIAAVLTITFKLMFN